jgi:Bacteriophage baseplate protein W
MMNQQIDYPYRFDAYGRTAVTGGEDHIRDLVAQVLFTAPGERVNRPDFGTGLLQMVFAPASDELATALQFLIQGALQQWLGDLIVVEAVTVEVEDSILRVIVRYMVRRTQQQRVDTFTQEVPA